MFDQISYDPPDADYGRIFTQARIIAWQYGFALLTHGSRTRDLDVLMVPWEARAYEKIVPAVINRIAEVTGMTLKGEPTEKPHGRKAYTLFLPDGVRWVDLSVMPCPPPLSSHQMNWQPIETAPRGSGEDGPQMVTDPDYVAPPKLLLFTAEGIVVGYYDWYYHPGYGAGAEDGESVWRDHNGDRTYGVTHWMPLPEAPAS